MMNWDVAFTLLALTLHVVAIATWLGLRKRVEKWIYWAVLTGFVSMFFHRIGEMWAYDPFPYFGHSTAVIIALVALSGVLQTRRYLRRNVDAAAALMSLHNKLENLANEVEHREPIATQIAEIMADLRSQIRFYEEQAKNHDLPLFPK